MKNVREILATDEVKAFSQPLQLLELKQAVGGNVYLVGFTKLIG